MRKNVEMSEGLLDGYRNLLLDEERSAATMEKYLRDVRTFLGYMGEVALDRKRVLDYKQRLRERYKITSANSMSAAMNSLFVHLGRKDLEVKLFKVRRVLHARPEREMTEKDYRKLIQAARNDGDEMMNMLTQIIGGTGVWISELKFITVESPVSGRTGIYSREKFRTVLLPVELSRILRKYCREAGTVAGSIFITKHRNPVGGSNVSKKMRALGGAAGMDTAKVSPHNLWHLFARVFYSIEKDVVRLMDLLGHSNISTTRIYTASTEEQPRGQMSRMKLVLGQPRQAEQ